MSYLNSRYSIRQVEADKKRSLDRFTLTMAKAQLGIGTANSKFVQLQFQGATVPADEMDWTTQALVPNTTGTINLVFGVPIEVPPATLNDLILDGSFTGTLRLKNILYDLTAADANDYIASTIFYRTDGDGSQTTEINEGTDINSSGGTTLSLADTAVSDLQNGYNLICQIALFITTTTQFGMRLPVLEYYWS